MIHTRVDRGVVVGGFYLYFSIVTHLFVNAGLIVITIHPNVTRIMS